MERDEHILAKKYKYEMHCHTDEVSTCSKVRAAELVEAYIEKGYSGIVITDHFSPHTFAAKKGLRTKDMIDYYLTGYRAAVEAAKGRINIILGMELAFYTNYNDYLVYGIDEDFLRKNPNIMDMGITNFVKLAKKKNLLVFQAHPFRNEMTMVRPDLLDGYEVYNGNMRHDSRNDIAKMWAEKFEKKIISGSDFHEWEDLARGGVEFSSPVTSSEELVKRLSAGDYKLIETK